jgi:hypothetical protein
MLSALISIFFGNFLIGVIFRPALDRLSKIQEEFLSIKIPSRDPLLRLRDPVLGAPQRHEEEASARRRFDETFRKYRLAYSPFRRISYVFLLAIILLGIMAVISLHLCLIWSLASCGGVIAILLSLAYFLSYTSYPWPVRLTTIDYLLDSFPNLHPESLIDLMGLRCMWWKEIGQTHLYLITAIPAVGYRYVVLVTDEDQTETFFAVWGSVSERTHINMSLSPETTQYQIMIGELDIARLNALGRPLSIHLYAFIPEPASWTPRAVSPCLVTSELNVYIGGEVGWPLAGGQCQSDRRDTGVKFDRKKWWLFDRWEITEIHRSSSLPNQYLRDYLRSKKRVIEEKWSSEAFPALTM